MSIKDVDLNSIPEPTDESEKEEEQVQGAIKDDEEPKDAGQALFALAGAPSAVQIEEWKTQFGEVLVAGNSEVELFVFRPLSRIEFINLQTYLSQAKEPVTPLEVEEKICNTCVLWASELALRSLESKAGTLTTLHEQIMQASNFVDPRYAGSFVVRL